MLDLAGIAIPSKPDFKEVFGRILGNLPATNMDFWANHDVPRREQPNANRDLSNDWTNAKRG